MRALEEFTQGIGLIVMIVVTFFVILPKMSDITGTSPFFGYILGSLLLLAVLSMLARIFR